MWDTPWGILQVGIGHTTQLPLKGMHLKNAIQPWPHRARSRCSWRGTAILFRLCSSFLRCCTTACFAKWKKNCRGRVTAPRLVWPWLLIRVPVHLHVYISEQGRLSASRLRSHPCCRNKDYAAIHAGTGLAEGPWRQWQRRQGDSSTSLRCQPSGLKIHALHH